MLNLEDIPDWIGGIASTIALIVFFQWIYSLRPADFRGENSPDPVVSVLQQTLPQKRSDEVSVYTQAPSNVEPPSSPTPMPALTGAVKDGDFAKVKALLASGADVNQDDADGTPPLIWAIKTNNIAMVKLLLTQPGIDVHCETSGGASAYSLSADNDDIRKLLEEHGAP